MIFLIRSHSDQPFYSVFEHEGKRFMRIKIPWKNINGEKVMPPPEIGYFQEFLEVISFYRFSRKGKNYISVDTPFIIINDEKRYLPEGDQTVVVEVLR